ncbi:hypothetical protein K144313037_07460 [Clostridium tetani]|uniref:DUF3311 domain-containing protein n=1 Tax=Clostridium tetani TaxID=1513 RepID=A0A4Q0VG59_CLOTA|nr:hypothetical protein [Clostridium tetani]AVP54347.1 hypothetical protein C3B72_04095 [Clostridium tetani]KGI40475.1 hypothetical protein LA33_07470 [Clostridium tetani ATCC 9441]KGI42342.1 hypothetical protein KY55_09650 [Clostridium tetani]RXI50513.1 hypothetical protein DP130_00650 [Clostridium tetani]RXI55160.1 hypothetical protein DP124_03060 [Clostridium tetani]
MNNKLILSIFAILLCAAMVPFGFTSKASPYIFGWLPFPLLYWWILMFVNLIFILWVCSCFVKSAQKDKKEEVK